MTTRHTSHHFQPFISRIPIPAGGSLTKRKRVAGTHASAPTHWFSSRSGSRIRRTGRGGEPGELYCRVCSKLLIFRVDAHEESVDSIVANCWIVPIWSSIVKRYASVRRMTSDHHSYLNSNFLLGPQASTARGPSSTIENSHKCRIPGYEISVGSSILANPFS